MLTRDQYAERFAEVIRRASTELPRDVVEALRRGREAEAQESLARNALGTILNNVEMARDKLAPICQDTGTPVVWPHHPAGIGTRMLRQAMEEAVRRATAAHHLRPNAVDTLTGKNTGDGAGRGIPAVHFEEWDDPAVKVELILKGGGSENVGAQYRLPDAALGAGRDLEGVRRVVLDAVVQAQGKGCSPGVLGVCVGGDRVTGFEEAKRQILRRLDDENPEPELAALEKRLLAEGNSLGVGPMGFGGRTTLLGVKIGVRDRLPASYFVSVCYMCWADRRASALIEEGGELRWLN